jgi:hypothetical protein
VHIAQSAEMRVFDQPRARVKALETLPFAPLRDELLDDLGEHELATLKRFGL